MISVELIAVKLRRIKPWTQFAFILKNKVSIEDNEREINSRIEMAEKSLEHHHLVNQVNWRKIYSLREK